MSSYAPAECCFVGFKHQGEAQGLVKKIGDHDAYVATPQEDTGKGILLIPDFMGFELINTKLLADQFAANGFTTIIPDVWEGDNVPLNYEPGSDFDLGQWVGRHPPSKVEPICEATIKAMKQEYGVKKLGAAGFCLGAKYVCRFMAKGKGLDAGYIAHPSLTSGDEVRGVDEPLTIAGAEVDDLFPPEKRRETEEILSSSGNRYSMTIYGGVEHGFGLKADLNNPWSKFVSETVFLQAVSWFDHFLKV